jgi:undecaprenyl-diphosphatase
MVDRLLTADGAVLLWIQAHLRAPVLDRVVSVYTTLGNAGVLFLLLAAVMLCFPKTRRAGVTALAAMAMGFLGTNLILKHLVARPRPWVEIPGLTALVAESDPNSFPSGHTTAAFAFALALWPMVPRRWMAWAALAAAVLMAFSRLYVGVHYPSDVFTGALIGCLSACLARWLCRDRRS